VTVPVTTPPCRPAEHHPSWTDFCPPTDGNRSDSKVGDSRKFSVSTRGDARPGETRDVRESLCAWPPRPSGHVRVWMESSVRRTGTELPEPRGRPPPSRPVGREAAVSATPRCAHRPHRPPPLRLPHGRSYPTPGGNSSDPVEGHLGAVPVDPDERLTERLASNLVGDPPGNVHPVVLLDVFHLGPEVEAATAHMFNIANSSPGGRRVVGARFSPAGDGSICRACR
jgi:hypothetical protein